MRTFLRFSSPKNTKVCHKTRVFVAAHSENFVILICTVFIGLKDVSDTWTNGRTDRRLGYSWDARFILLSRVIKTNSTAHFRLSVIEFHFWAKILCAYCNINKCEGNKFTNFKFSGLYGNRCIGRLLSSAHCLSLFVCTMSCVNNDYP